MERATKYKIEKRSITILVCEKPEEKTSRTMQREET
jgi:hypothetical protein